MPESMGWIPLAVAAAGGRLNPKTLNPKSRHHHFLPPPPSLLIVLVSLSSTTPGLPPGSGFAWAGMHGILIITYGLLGRAQA